MHGYKYCIIYTTEQATYYDGARYFGDVVLTIIGQTTIVLHYRSYAAWQRKVTMDKGRRHGEHIDRRL